MNSETPNKKTAWINTAKKSGKIYLRIDDDVFYSGKTKTDVNILNESIIFSKYCSETKTFNSEYKLRYHKSRAGKQMIMLSRFVTNEEFDTEFVGVTSISTAEKFMNNEIKGLPITLF